MADSTHTSTSANKGVCTNLIHLVTSFHIPEACQAPGLPTPPQLGSLAGDSSFYHTRTPKLLLYGTGKNEKQVQPRRGAPSRRGRGLGPEGPSLSRKLSVFGCCSILIRPILPSFWPKNVYSPEGGR